MFPPMGRLYDCRSDLDLVDGTSMTDRGFIDVTIGCDSRVRTRKKSFPALLAALRPVLDMLECEYEILFVDDGSRDGSAEHSGRGCGGRSCGSRCWASAGTSATRRRSRPGSTSPRETRSSSWTPISRIPPELLPRDGGTSIGQGFDVVSAQRVGRDGEGPFKRGTAACLYGLMRRAVDERLQPQVGDFRLFSRAAVTGLRGLREQHRFVRGMWPGSG